MYLDSGGYGVQKCDFIQTSLLFINKNSVLPMP
jgi:hypothetical protein